MERFKHFIRWNKNEKCSDIEKFCMVLFVKFSLKSFIE